MKNRTQNQYTEDKIIIEATKHCLTPTWEFIPPFIKSLKRLFTHCSSSRLPSSYKTSTLSNKIRFWFVFVWVRGV